LQERLEWVSSSSAIFNCYSKNGSLHVIWWGHGFICPSSTAMVSVSAGDGSVNL
jgi:hypothetical protein